MHPAWRDQLHNPTPPTPLPPYLQTTVTTALTAITPSLLSTAPPSSVLLIGPPSSGKSLVTARILHHLHQQAPNLVHLPLTGLLHPTPLRAWRHLSATLSRHTAHRTDHADHADHDDEAGEADTAPATTVQHCLAVITARLTTLRESRTPVLLTLDHFDRFITTHDGTTQTVLYSLLNFLQDRHMRIACIALTSSIDSTDALEKRVKSRFLHRQLVMELPQHPEQILAWVCDVLLPRGSRRGTPTAKLVRAFLKHDRCVAAVKASLLRTRVAAPVLRALDAALFAALHEPPNKALRARVDHACTIFELVLAPADPMREMLRALTELEIVLLVSLRKLVQKAERRDEKAVMCFTDVFRCYENAMVEEGFSTVKDGDRLVERGVAEKCWERLVECGLVARVGHGPREMRSCLLGVAGVDVDDALRTHSVASLVWKNWGKKP